VTDKVLAAFLERQYAEGMALARESDLLDLQPGGGPPVQRYLARFHCFLLSRRPAGEIVKTQGATVGIFFDDQYLRRVDPYTAVVWLCRPEFTWHPNISNRAPLICLGRLAPGTGLVDILYQIFEILTYQRYATHDALNRDAAAWARQNQDQFPVDARPLKRRTRQFTIEEPAAAGGEA